jgi:hypothetical protein
MENFDLVSITILAGKNSVGPIVEGLYGSLMEAGSLHCFPLLNSERLITTWPEIES